MAIRDEIAEALDLNVETEGGVCPVCGSTECYVADMNIGLLRCGNTDEVLATVSARAVCELPERIEAALRATVDEAKEAGSQTAFPGVRESCLRAGLAALQKGGSDDHTR